MAIARRSAIVAVMIEAAEKAGRSLLRDFGEVENLQVSRKGPGDFVSTADLKSEKIIKTALQKARPKFGFLLEEGGEEKGEDATTRWIADPLDGTTNFLHGVPHWSVSIALEKDKEIMAGVVYDPIKDEMFWAEKGMGAYMNSRRMQVSGRRNFADALLSVGNEGDGQAEDFIADFSASIPTCSGFRRFGSACLDLAYVAAGRFDAFWERGLKPWDAAAGGLLVREARGIATDYEGGKDYVYAKSILAANPVVYADLSKMLGKKAKAAS
jgi:myo-inositol-1(or 4)-monophosphatase